MDSISLLSQIDKNTRSKPQQTLEFKMNTNREKFYMDETLMLDDGNYMLGVILFGTYNSIPNITSKNNLLTYSINNGSSWKQIFIPIGPHEIEAINNEVHRQLEINGDVFNNEDNGYPIEITANINTFKTIIECKTGPGISNVFHIDFTQPNSLNTVFGFNPQILTNEYNVSENNVNIITVDKVHLRCDAVRGSILNGVGSDILFSFNINVSPGYKLVIQPSTILYKYIIKEKLESIEFYFSDDDGEPVEWLGETITFTTQLIKIS